jgi:hypothetical protein
LTAQILPRVFTYQITDNFSANPDSNFTPQTGQWVVSGGRYTATPAAGDAALSTRPLNVTSSSYVEYQATVRANTTGASAGLVFGYTDPNNFLYAAVVAGSNQVVLGHRSDGRWFTDAVLSTTINAGTDYTLLVALDNSPEGGGSPTVNVVLNGATALSHTYNFQTVGSVNQGNLRLGLLSQNGSASFANVSIRGDDPAYAGGGTPQLTTSPALTQAAAVSPLTANQLQPIVQAAIARWRASPALHGNDQLLRQAQVTIAALPGLMLGQTIGNSIVIDPTAAGYGWFVDATPLGDSEFHRGNVNGLLVANTFSPALGHMDLETVVLHELGHVLGLDDVKLPAWSADLMATTLEPGVRRLPDGLSPVLDTAVTTPAIPSRTASLATGVPAASLGGQARPAAPLFSASTVVVQPGWMAPALLSDRTAPTPELDARFMAGARANVQALENLVGSRFLLSPAFWAGTSGDQWDESSRQWQVNAYFLSSRSSQPDWVPDGMGAASLGRDRLGHSSASDRIFAGGEMGVPLDLLSESGDDVLSDAIWLR